jgi:hypothetical protein
MEEGEEMDGEARAARDRVNMEERALQAKIDEVSHELKQHEEQLLNATSDSDQRRLKRAIREADRRRGDLRAALDRFKLNAQMGEFSSQICSVQSDCRAIGQRQTSLEDKQTVLEGKIAEESHARCNMEDRVQRLEHNQAILHEDNMAMRRGLDRIDNQQRIQSLVFYGLDASRPYEAIADYLPSAILAGVDVASPMGPPSEQERVRIGVRFSTVGACQIAAQYLSSPEFESRNRGLSWGYNKSEMERVGRSRMLACTDGLRQQFREDIEIRTTFVRFYGQKYTAIEFAAGSVRIGGVDLDIDAHVSANPKFEVNPAVVVRHSGRTYTGCKRRGGRGAPRGRWSRRTTWRTTAYDGATQQSRFSSSARTPTSSGDDRFEKPNSIHPDDQEHNDREHVRCRRRECSVGFRHVDFLYHFDSGHGVHSPAAQPKQCGDELLTTDQRNVRRRRHSFCKRRQLRVQQDLDTHPRIC